MKETEKQFRQEIALYNLISSCEHDCGDCMDMSCPIGVIAKKGAM